VVPPYCNLGFFNDILKLLHLNNTSPINLAKRINRCYLFEKLLSVILKTWDATRGKSTEASIGSRLEPTLISLEFEVLRKYIFCINLVKFRRC
jgi:hypothetical protein